MGSGKTDMTKSMPQAKLSSDGKYRLYLLSVLAVVLAFNIVDRLAMGLVLEDIKRDLGLSDTQLGLLTGFAFAAFYATVGLPMARWADRRNRVSLVSLTTLLWGIAVALCAVVTTFWQMLAVRVFVGVGEAGTRPAGQSLIGDHFIREERPKATAIFMLGGPIGVIIGYTVAGWLNALFGWRLMFVLLAAPGLLLALLVKFSLHEPRAGPDQTSRSAAGESALSVCARLIRDVAFRNLLIGYAVLEFFNYGILQWQPTFFIRSHGLSTAELGLWLGLIYGAGGLAGTMLGGEIATRWAARDEARQLRLTAAGFALFGIAKAGLFIVDDLTIALAFLAFAVIGAATAIAPLFSTLQSLVSARERATAVALILFASNLIGMGFGPIAIGILSDWFLPIFGGESLRYALLLLCPGFFWSALHIWRAAIAIDRRPIDSQSRQVGE